MENSKPTILIIDDVRTIIMALEVALRDDYEVISATSGLEGLELALARNPDLILLDIMMPEMDGYEVCRILKTDPKTKNIPVIFVTGLDKVENEAQGLAMGAIDYITKPLYPGIVKARVKNHLESKRRQDRLEKLSLTDALTGIANRRHFDIVFHREWETALKNEDQLAVILIDVDHFKVFNDTYGHLAGDLCLQTVGKILKDSLQSGFFAARYGGEEFVCLLPGVNVEGAWKVAEKIRQKIEALRIPHSNSETGEVVTMSIGVAAMIPQPDYAPASLLKMADQALYRAKGNGRNRVATGLKTGPHQEDQYWRKIWNESEPEDLDQFTLPVNL